MTKIPWMYTCPGIAYLYSLARISSINPQNPNHISHTFHLASSATPNNPSLLKTRVSGEDGWRQDEEIENRREFGGYHRRKTHPLH